MVSEVDISNFALQLLGAEQISSLTEGTVAANACNLSYDQSRKSALESHPWNFALKRVALSKLSAAPAFGFDNAFALPSDFIRMLATEKQQDLLQVTNPDFNGYVSISNSIAFADADYYKLEVQDGQKVLLSDDATKNIIYVYDVTDTSLFSPMFIDYHAAHLASKISYKVTGAQTSVERMLALAKEYKSLAQKSDGRQDTNRRTESSSYLASRYYP